MRLVILILLLAACSPVDASRPLQVEVPSPAIGEDELLESIGLETLGGVLTPILAAGCDLPCESTQTFSTATDGQTEIKLSLNRGTTDLVRDAHSLGEFTIHGSKDTPRGTPKIFVTLRADVEGILISSDGGPGEKLGIRRTVE